MPRNNQKLTIVILSMTILFILLSSGAFAWVGNYAYKNHILYQPTSNLSFSVNGPMGYCTSDNIIWANPIYGDLFLYYDNCTSYAIGNETTMLPYETEDYGANYTPTDTYPAIANIVYHMSNNTTATVKDYSQYQHNGTPNQIIRTAGIYDGAFQFTLASTSYITVPSSLTATPQSMCSYVNFNSLQVENTLFATGGEGAATKGLTFIFNNTGDLLMYSNNGVNPTTTARINLDLTTNTWYHICYTWDGTANAANLIVYINNTPYTSGTAPETWAGASNAQFEIGDFFAGAHFSTLNGVIDEMAFYNDTLTPNQIEELYNNSQHLNLLLSTLHFNGTTATPPSGTQYNPDTNYTFNATICTDDTTTTITQANFTINGTLWQSIGIENATSWNYTNTTENITTPENATDGNWDTYAFVNYSNPFETDYILENYTIHGTVANLTIKKRYFFGGIGTAIWQIPSSSVYCLNTSSLWYDMAALFYNTSTPEVMTAIIPASCLATTTLQLNNTLIGGNSASRGHWYYESNVTVNPPIVVNDSCNLYTFTSPPIGAGNHSYTWNATDTAGGLISAMGYYYIAPNTSNTAVITVLPGTSVTTGTPTTATCTADHGTPVLRLDGVYVSNPHSITLPAGVHTYVCNATHANYTTASASTTVTVGTIGPNICHNNTTFAYYTNLTVTAATTILDFTNYSTNAFVRNDLGDIYAGGRTITINGTFANINTAADIGNSILIYFGNYLVNYSYAAGGLNTSTDNITNLHEYNSFAYLTFQDEISMNITRAPNTNTTLVIYCDAGMERIVLDNSSNITRLVVATFSNWTELLTRVEYSTTDYYLRHYLFDSSVEYKTIWIVDAVNYPVAKVTNTLHDLTGQFPTARLTIKTWIGGLYATVDDQYFDASKIALFYGIIGSKYQYFISNGAETRVLGDVWVDTGNLDKTITLSELNFGLTELVGNLTITASFNNNTGVITGYYHDPYNRTNYVNFSVYNMSDTLLYLASAGTNSTAVFTYLTPSMNATYKVRFDISHNDQLGTLAYWFLLGATIVGAVFRVFAGSLFGAIASLFTIFAINITVGQKFAAFGFVISGLFAVMFAGIGWLPIPGAVVIFAVLLAMLWFMRSEVNKE